MASGHIKGTARITYTPFGDSTEIVHLLAVPFLEVRPAKPQRRFEWWSADGSARSTRTIGDSQLDVVVTIRMDNDQEGLTELLRQALEHDIELNYLKEESADPITFKVVAIVGATDPGDIALDPDPDRFGFGEYMVRLHLRATGSSTWEAIL